METTKKIDDFEVQAAILKTSIDCDEEEENVKKIALIISVLWGKLSEGKTPSLIPNVEQLIARIIMTTAEELGMGADRVLKIATTFGGNLEHYRVKVAKK